MKDNDHKWIQQAVHHPGAFTAKAKSHHMGTQEYAQKMKHAGGTVGKQARLAITLSRLAKRK